MEHPLGKTLLIVNPTAQNGSGAAAGERAACELEAKIGADALTVLHTAAGGQASEFAADASGYDTVVVLGGDGTIHEAVNGLMKIEAAARPALGIIPCGTGNDFARALNMKRTLEDSLARLFEARLHTRDLGLCNGRYFMETLSFGLDADIALTTVELREKTGHTGTRVFAEAGVDALLHRRFSYPYTLRTEDGLETKGHMLLFAVQVGPYYGGGFMICPQANPSDNSFDLCIAHPPISTIKALTLFAMAKKGMHTHSKRLEFSNSSKLELVFAEEGPLPPAQIDGEKIEGARFQIESVPAALRVIS